MVVYVIKILYPIPTYVNTIKINPLYKTLIWIFVSETAILAQPMVRFWSMNIGLCNQWQMGEYLRNLKILKKKNNSFEEQNQIESEARRQKVAVRTARSVSENKELLSAL